MQHIFGFFSLGACFDPSNFIFRKYYNALENMLSYNYYKSILHDRWVNDYSFKILDYDKKSLVVKHTKQNVVYKVYYGCKKHIVQNRGEDIVKHIKSDYICNIYDTYNVQLFLIQPSVFTYLKIIATEALDKSLNHESLVGKYKEQNSAEKLKELKDIVRSVVLGVIEMHKKDIVHLDIKPQNVMSYTKKGIVKYKLIDFGGSQKLKTKGYGVIEYTPGYQSPLFNGSYDNISKADDIWGIGMLAYVLYTGIAYHSNDEKKSYSDQYLFFIRNRNSIIKDKIQDDDLKDFIEKCLEEYEARRPTAEELEKHAFLKNE
ncbi:Serine/threonine-protein kinase 17A [Binucleata daphniae]